MTSNDFNKIRNMTDGKLNLLLYMTRHCMSTENIVDMIAKMPETPVMHAADNTPLYVGDMIKFKFKDGSLMAACHNIYTYGGCIAAYDNGEPCIIMSGDITHADISHINMSTVQLMN